MLADTLKEHNKHEPQRGQSQREYYLSDRGSVGEDVLLRSDDSLAITAENEHAKFVGEPDRVGFPRPNLASAPENQTCQHGDDAVVVTMEEPPEHLREPDEAKSDARREQEELRPNLLVDRGEQDTVLAEEE